MKHSLPATTGMLVNVSFNIIDTIFVGMLGSGALAALSVAFPVQMMLGGVAIGTGVGAASLVARQLGAAQYEEASETASQSFSLAFLLGIAVIFIGFFYLDDLLVVFGTTPDIMGDTFDYLSIIIWGAPTIFLMMMGNNVIRGEGSAMVAMKIMVAGALLNIALDPIFIFALGLGIRGAALATVISRSLILLYVVYYFIFGNSMLKISLKWFLPRWSVVVEIYRVGIPAIFMQVAFNLAIIFVNRILGGYDHVAIAVLGIIVRLQMVILLPCIGISQGLLTIIGFNYGGKLYGRVREAFFKATMLAFVFSLIVTALFVIFPTTFIGIFNREPELLVLGSYALRIMVVTFPLAALQIMSSVLFQGIGRGLPALVLAVSRQFLFFVPLAYLFEFWFDLDGIWFSAPAADLLTCLIALFLITRAFKNLGLPFWSYLWAKILRQQISTSTGSM